LFRPFLLPFSPLFFGLFVVPAVFHRGFPPFSILIFKKCQKGKKTNFPAENLKEIYRKKERKRAGKVNCETPRRVSLFPCPFQLAFSISWSSGASIVPQQLHTTSDVQKRLG
jgi:hypothetical protein